MATDKDKENEGQAPTVDPNAVAPETSRRTARAAQEDAPSRRADETIDGGRYINAQGHYVNANGQYITFDGKVVDEPVKARK